MKYVGLTAMVKNIDWDTETDSDYADDYLATDIPFLPNELKVPLTLPEGYTEGDVTESILNALSEDYGFLVRDYQYEILPSA
jgi:hypothetical protein